MRRAFAVVIAGMMVLASAGADDITDQELNTFNAGEPARASEVNHNFDAVQAAVNDNDARLDTLEGQTADFISGVPVGAVIDWWRPDATFPIPEKFAIADGSVVSDPQSPLHGYTLPDLTDTFVRGVTDPAAIGSTGGATNHGHDVYQPSHAHTYSVAHDHPAESTPGHHHGWATYFNGAWYSFTSPTTWTAITSGGERGSSGDPWISIARESPDQVDLYTNTESVTVDLNAYDPGSRDTSTAPADTLNADPADHLPPWVGLLKLVRIR